MTHAEQSIQKAADAGYKWNGTGSLYCKIMDGQLLCRADHEFAQLVVVEKVLLDPLFWEALKPNHGLALMMRLVLHLYSGGDIESYFRELEA